jgi:hypothetical protein
MLQTFVSNVSSFFPTYVASAFMWMLYIFSHICYKCFIWMLRMFAIVSSVFQVFLQVFQTNVSNVSLS